MGRWFEWNEHCRRTIAQGNSFEATVEGAASLNLIGRTPLESPRAVVVAVSVDGRPYQRHRVPRASRAVKTYLSSLNGGTHRISVVVSGIFEEAPLWISAAGLEVCGLQIDRGVFKRTLQSTRKVLFIGDSISAGIVVLGHTTDPQTPSTPEVSAAEDSFTFLAAQHLGVQSSFSAFGRTGVVVSGNGGVPGAHEHAFFYAKDRPVTDESPDLIQIALGTNDTTQHVDRAAFHTAYLQLIRAEAKAHPAAQIVLLPPFTEPRAYASEVRAIGLEAGVPVIDTRNWHISTVDGTHPDVAGSEVAGLLDADALQPFLKHEVAQQ